MDRPAQVIIKAGQVLSPRHEELIDRFLVRSEWELLSIPREGLAKDQINGFLKQFLPPTAIIFASYEPLLLALFCRRTDQSIYVFRTDDGGRLELCLV